LRPRALNLEAQQFGRELCSESHPDIRFIEAKLKEIADELDVLKRQRLEISKEKGQPSPGLLAAIARLEQRQSAFRESLELWKAVLRVHPNIDH
jgi:hypothetical protein